MILFTSDIKRTVLSYSGMTIFLVILNYIYSFFSHQVSSNYMTYMFLYPLVGGVFISTLLILFRKLVEIKFYYVGKAIFNYGIATLTIRSFIKGVFQIAGTDSDYLVYYFYIGSLFIMIGFICILVSIFQATNNR